jgi:glycosyltransferase involved in cell wall biosynthesis
MSPARAGVRLAILDDGLFVRTPAGTVHSVAATFHRFVEAVVRTGPFGGRARYVVPVRQMAADEPPPALPAVDQRLLEIVPTAPFRGIADYVARWPIQLARNWPPISRAVRDSDLVWLRLPASNALPALLAGKRHGVPHFTWQAGKVGAVVVGQQRPLPLHLLARVVGAGYDTVSALSRRSGPFVELDDELFASVVTQADIDGTPAPTVRPHGPWVIAWAGRMAPEKGLDDLLDALRLLIDEGRDVRLLLVGDGPVRPQLERQGEAFGERLRIEDWVSDRTRYLALLRGADIFVHPSHAEGVPKVLLDAMTAGLPIVASAVGRVPELLGGGLRGRLVPPSDPGRLAGAVGSLLDDAAQQRLLSTRGMTWAAEHTMEAQARRVVDWLTSAFPELLGE